MSALIRALHVSILRSLLVKKNCKEVSWKVGKMKLRPTQKHNVIYEISDEENLNRWRDKEDQLQM